MTIATAYAEATGALEVIAESALRLVGSHAVDLVTTEAAIDEANHLRRRLELTLGRLESQRAAIFEEHS